MVWLTAYLQSPQWLYPVPKPEKVELKPIPQGYLGDYGCRGCGRQAFEFAIIGQCAFPCCRREVCEVLVQLAAETMHQDLTKHPRTRRAS